MKQNLKNKIDKLAGMLILLNFIIIGALAVAGFLFGFRFESGKEVLLFLIPLVIIVAITATVLQISKEGEE
jgi:hypothetical protein